MKIRIHTTVLLLLSVFFSGISPGISQAHAQFRGEWPGDVRAPRAGDMKSPHAERMVARPGGDELSIPRGDLRKDVYDASRDLPRSRGQ